ncbi:hypothetical protein AcV5_006864 [Taiwanofungus camphoratus]|nr:hypothetical protein AcV5_006864 [Antrodia cinnamomea]
MAARWSAGNSPLPSSGDLGREGVSPFGRPPSALGRTSPAGRRTRHRWVAASTHSTSSEPDLDSDSDADADADSREDSAGSLTVGVRRNRTITLRSAAKARSELGHHVRLSPVHAPVRMMPSSSVQSNASRGCHSVYSRARRLP